MNIVQVVEKLDIGGLEKIVLDLSNYLSSEHNILIISLQDFDRNKINNWISINKNITIKSLEKRTKNINKLNSWKNILKMILKMRIELNKFNPDIVHTHHIGPLIYTILSTLSKNTKIIHTEHDIWYLNNKKNKIIRKALLKVKNHKTIALTKKMETDLNQIFKIKNTKTIFNGIDLDTLTSITDAKQKLNIEEEFVIGCCGRIEEVKNHRYLIEQAKQFKDVRFLIAGNGSLFNELSSDAPNNVTFLGHQNNLSLFFSAIDAFCLPSNNEGLPLSILEAYFYNKPVYATNVGSIKEIISDEKYFIKTTENLDILRMKEDKYVNMRDKIINHFSLQNMSTKYLMTYKE